MKKFVTQCAFLLLPALAFAQKDAPLLKEFGKKIFGITNSVAFNNHAYAVLMATGEKSSELAAVDDQMKELWRTPLQGEAGQVGRFKGNLLAYTVADHGKQETFTGYLIDPNTGKILLQKVVYDGENDYQDQVLAVFTDDDAVARLVLRESGIHKTGLFPGNNFSETKGLTIVDVDDKLNGTISKPAIPDGDFISLTSNQQGDVFILTSQKDKTVMLTKYDAGKSGAGTPIVQDIDSRKQAGTSGAMIAASHTSNNIAYLALIQDNRHKDRVLTLCKFDFGAHTAQVTSVPFDKAHIKSLEKNFAPLYKKMPKPEMGGAGIPGVRHLEDYNGNLLVSVSSQYTGSYQLGDASAVPTAANTGKELESYAVDVLGFDLNLQPKFELVLPVYYQYIHFLKNSYHGDGNYYDILASNTRYDKGAFYSRIDLTTGKLVKFEMLTIDNKHLLDNNALWFSNDFLVPFSSLPGILPPHKLSVDLMQVNY